MDLDQHILAVVEPAIDPTPIEIVDVGEEEDGGDKQTKTVGAVIPSIQINKYLFGDKDISSCDINMDGILPEVEMELIDRNDALGSDYSPRDGDCVTVFINSKNVDTFKTIHMDFEITDISSEGTSEGGYPTILVSGICKIPRLFAEVCREFPNGTSLDHLELIARDLKLGLATNVDTADDAMQRLQTYTPTSDFIKSIVSSSYISDDSFQKYFIDQYYYLNFIDVNRVFNSVNGSIEELQESLASMSSSVAEKGSEDETSDNIPTKLMLTNHQDHRSSNAYITSFKLVNNSNTVSLENGYERNVSYYDNNSPDQKLLEFNIQPLVSENLQEIEEPLRGRRGEDTYKEQVKFKYMGRMNAGEDGLGNVHPNALYSTLSNIQNSAELNKMYLTIELEEFNPSIYKYQKLPVMIYKYGSSQIEALKVTKEAKKELGLDTEPIKDINKAEVTNEEEPDQMLDTFLSGYYVIGNINYKYSVDVGLTQEVTLLRREWPARLNNLTD